MCTFIIMNIINICIELQRSKREAQIERDYLQNLYRYMPLGYVRFRMILPGGEKCADVVLIQNALQNLRL